MKDSSFVTIPKWMITELLDIAKEQQAQNEWKRNGSDRTKREMVELDDFISRVQEYLDTTATLTHWMPPTEHKKKNE